MLETPIINTQPLNNVHVWTAEGVILYFND